MNRSLQPPLLSSEVFQAIISNMSLILAYLVNRNSEDLASLGKSLNPPVKDYCGVQGGLEAKVLLKPFGRNATSSIAVAALQILKSWNLSSSYLALNVFMHVIEHTWVF